MPVRSTFLLIGALTLVGVMMPLGASPLWAQTRTTGSTTGSTGTTGQTGTTGSTGSTTSSASRTTGTATSGGNTSGSLQTMSPIGNEPTFNSADGTLGEQVGQGGFTGRQNQGFAGNRNATQTGSGATLTPQFNQFGNQTQNNRGGSTGNSSIKRARPQQRIAFTYPKSRLAETQVVVGERIGRLTGVHGVGTSISDQGVVTLTGSVGSEDTKKLAEALVRLEPGVRSVQNEIQVSP